MCDSWFEKGKCTLQIKMEFWHKSDYCLGCGESGHPHLLGILTDFRYCCLSLSPKNVFWRHGSMMMLGLYDIGHVADVQTWRCHTGFGWLSFVSCLF